MSISNITFVDFETVPAVLFEDLSYDLIILFEHRHSAEIQKAYSALGEVDPDAQTAALMLEIKKVYNEKAGLSAEFGKIVSVAIGKMFTDDKFYIKSIASRNEVDILNKANEALIKIATNDKAPITLCAHNGFEFDYPFWTRRCIINRLPIPEPLRLHGKKPWDILHQDTMKIWSGTAWNYRVSLDLLANVFGLPSSKAELQGKNVAKLYYDSFKPVDGELPFDTEEKALKKIGSYCAGDALTLANVFSVMKGFPILDESKVEYL